MLQATGRRLARIAGWWVLLLPLAAFAGLKPAARVQTSARSGWFTQSFSLELATDSPGATILFTTNGALPHPNSATVYREPITIAHTTIVRAIATHPKRTNSAVSTWSFCRADDLLTQTGAGWPDHWGSREGLPVPADYAMDPTLMVQPSFPSQLAAAVGALPTMSVVVDPSDLFDSNSGIYAHPTESGEAWERAASVEYFPTPTSDLADTGFRQPCGIRIQGGWNRRPEESPKHSLRLIFRKRYGESPLRYPLFPGRPTEFSTLILRGGNNNSWLHWSSEERRRADYLRDEWMRQTYAALGRTSARGRWVHVYLNGLYWGIYDLCERPDEHFAAAHLGGTSAEYDARNADKILNGDDEAWRSLLRRIEAGVPDAAALAEVNRLLDLPAFIDFVLLNLYGANGDLDGSSNWYAARRRKPEGRFLFFVWDGERTLEQVQDSRLSEDAADSPWRIFQKLRQNEEFRRQFAARARSVCRGDGPLAPAPAAARFRQLAGQLAPALPLESARWGDHRLTVTQYKTGPYERYTVEQHWRPEIKRLLDEYFPARSAAFLQQLQAGGFPVE